jgi:predicted enzyme related to lactoylglutathione lyase
MPRVGASPTAKVCLTVMTARPCRVMMDQSQGYCLCVMIVNTPDYPGRRTRAQSGRIFMRTSGITAALPAQDLARAKAFYLEKVGLELVQSNFLNASDGRVGLTLGAAGNQFVVYPAEARSSGEFMQVALQIADVRAAEEYDSVETHTTNGIAQTPDGREGAWFKDSEGNLVAIVSALAG